MPPVQWQRSIGVDKKLLTYSGKAEYPKLPFQTSTYMSHNKHTCYVPVMILRGNVNKNEATGTLENLSREEGKKKTWEAVGLSIPSFLSSFGVWRNDELTGTEGKLGVWVHYWSHWLKLTCTKVTNKPCYSTNYKHKDRGLNKKGQQAFFSKTTSGNHITDGTVAVASVILVPWCWLGK